VPRTNNARKPRQGESNEEAKKERTESVTGVLARMLGHASEIGTVSATDVQDLD